MVKLFDLFKKKEKDTAAPKVEETPLMEDLALYSGMRVEVTRPDGRFLFVAKLQGLRGNEGELHQYSEVEITQSADPIVVKIRGYSDRDKKAVCMEGAIVKGPQHIWRVQELRIERISNERAFFRLDTNIDATATMFTGLSIGEKPCKLINISVGGACISSQCQYHSGDKFLLKVRLLEDRPESVMYCQVLRIIEKDGSNFEYGCRFLELTEEDQDRITANIFTAQRQKRARA